MQIADDSRLKTLQRLTAYDRYKASPPCNVNTKSRDETLLISALLVFQEGFAVMWAAVAA